MATVIDALTVSLSLDAKGFTSGQRQTRVDLKKTADAATVAAKEMEARGAQAAAFFSRVKVEALGLAGVLLGGYGIQAFARDATKSLVELGNAAANAGENVQEVDAFSKAIERNGGSAEDAANNLVKLRTALTNFKLGLGASPEFLSTMSLIGANPNESPEQVIQQLAQYMKSVSVPQGNIIGARLGLSQELLNALRRINAGIGLPAELARSHELGLIDPKDIKAAQDFQHAIISVGEAAFTAGEKFFAKFAPGVAKTSENLATLIGQFPQLAGAIEGAVVGLIALKWVPRILGALGLATAGEIAAALALLYEGLHIGGTNEPELGPGDYKGTPTDLPTGVVPGSAIAPPPTGTPAYAVMQQTRAFWLSKGFTEAQVAGILAGGPAAESGFNPSLAGDGGTSYGLYQEHAGRKDALFARFGPNPTVDQQNQFAWEELSAPQQRNLLAAMRAAKTPQEAARIWTKGFEFPKNADTKATDRAAGAPSFLPSRKPDPALATGPRVNRSSANNTTHITNGPVTVHTQATDATGTAKAVQQAITDSWMVQANRGLQ